MPDETLPGCLRARAESVGLSRDRTTREYLLDAASELETRACRICELEAELKEARTWQATAEGRGRELDAARDRIAALERSRERTVQEWGSEFVSDLDAYPAMILGPGMRIDPARRAVLIGTWRRDALGDIDAIVRCGPIGAPWRLKNASPCGMDGDLRLWRAELEPIDAHSVPLDTPVRELPLPETDLGWVPPGGNPPSDAMDSRQRGRCREHGLASPCSACRSLREADDEAMHRR